MYNSTRYAFLYSCEMKWLDFIQVKGIGLDSVVSGSSSCIYHIYLTVYLDAEYA